MQFYAVHGRGVVNRKVDDLLARDVGTFCARNEKSATIDPSCVPVAI